MLKHLLDHAEDVNLTFLRDRGLRDLPLVRRERARRGIPREDLRHSLEARSGFWGIEIVPGSAMKFPEGLPEDLEMYGDPVNLKFPIDTLENAQSARARFKQFAETLYMKEDSRMVVHNRIVARQLELGLTVIIDESDALDMLLSDMFWEAQGVTILEEVAKSEKALLILKSEVEQRMVFGIVLEPDVTDIHLDTYDEPAVEGAAHHFMENMQNIGKQHTQIINGQVRILESYVTPVAMTLDTPSGSVKIRKGTWLMKVRIVADDIWSQIKAGELTGFSIGALCTAINLEEQ